jgi:hypothetical protein
MTSKMGRPEAVGGRRMNLIPTYEYPDNPILYLPLAGRGLKTVRPQ